MKKSILVSLFFISLLIGCSSSDDTPVIKVIEEEKIEETNEVSGADLLYNGTALMVTEDSRMPYIFYSKEGVKVAVIDENLDGDFNKITLTDGDFEAVIEMDVNTGLPLKLYTSENILILYNFKENHTLLDIAFIQPETEPIYIYDTDVSDFALSSKHAINSKTGACNSLPPILFSAANGMNWALGGWCKIRANNSVIFQSRNLSSKECDDIYRDMFPCCQISPYLDAYCKQIPNQAKVLAVIPELEACAKDGQLGDCIGNALTNVQGVLNNANSLRSLIGEDLILQSENVIYDLIEENLGGNAALVGKWYLDREEELFEGTIDTTVAGIEYCEDAPLEDNCYTLVEQYVEFNEGGTFRSNVKQLEKQNGTTGPADEIIEKYVGKWSYNAETDKLLLVAFSYEYWENGVAVEVDDYEQEGGQIIYVESFTVTNTNLIIVSETEDPNADGIPDESFTEFYTKS